MTASIVAKHVLIKGRVQRVGFRGWTVSQARDLGLSGWVRNLPSGDVELVASGPPDKVQALVEVCRHGSRWAWVEAVQVVGDVPPVDGPFRQRR